MVMAAVLIKDMALYSIAGDSANKMAAFGCFLIATFSAIILTVPRYAQPFLRAGQTWVGRVFLLLPAVGWLLFFWLFLLFRVDPETGLVFEAVDFTSAVPIAAVFTILYLGVFVAPGSVFVVAQTELTEAVDVAPRARGKENLRKLAQLAGLVVLFVALVKLYQAVPSLGYMGALMPFVVFGAGCIWVLSSGGARRDAVSKGQEDTAAQRTADVVSLEARLDQTDPAVASADSAARRLRKARALR